MYVRKERLDPRRYCKLGGVEVCSTPLPPRKKCKVRRSEILFPAFPEISTVHTVVCSYMEATLLRAATPFVIVGVGPGHFIIHLPFLHRDVFRVVRFLSVWGLGTTTLY